MPLTCCVGLTGSVLYCVCSCSSLAEPPCILEKPDSMNVLPGSKVQFNVLLCGTPPLTIRWFKSNKEILPSADCSVIKDSTSSSLELFFAKASDSGEYLCEVHNAVGAASCQATLFVKGCQSVLTSDIVNQSLSLVTHLMIASVVMFLRAS